MHDIIQLQGNIENEKKKKKRIDYVYVYGIV